MTSKDPVYTSMKAVLDVLTDQPQTFKDIHAQVRKDHQTVRNALRVLAELKLIEKMVAPRSLWTSNLHHPFFAWRKVERIDIRKQEL